MALDNNAGIILSIFGFYIALGIIFGLIGQTGLETSGEFSNVPDDDMSITESIIFFFQGVGFTISSLPAWANTLIFLPLGITIIYIIAELVAVAFPL